MRIAVAVAVVLALTSVARADDVVTYRADGAAPATSADDQAGRTAALDAAFQAATEKALADLAAPEALAAQHDAVEAQVVRRARLWVASFKVGDQRLVDGTLTVTVDAKIDTAKLAAKLTELGVELGGGSGGDQPSGPPPETKSALLLLRVSTVEGAIATYGAGGNPHAPGADAATVALTGHGVLIVPASSEGPAARAGDGLPLSDDAARDAASKAQAAIVIVAGVDQRAPGRVRGSHAIAGLAFARVRILDVAAGQVVGDAQAASGEIADGAPAASSGATSAALLAAIAAAYPVLQPAVAAPVLPLPAPADGEVLVRLHDATGAQAQGLRSYLASAQGVKSVTWRRFGPGEVVLAVRGVRADHTAALVRADADLGAKARVEDSAVEVTLP